MDIPTTTDALVKISGKGLGFREKVPVPLVGDRDVMLKVWSASICGSDLHIYDNDEAFRDRVVENQLIGHEFCGEVIKIGKQVTKLAVGDIVAAESHVSCGSCYYCLNGEPHICQEVTALGFDRPGGFAQFTVIPEENAIPLPKGISHDVGACLEPLGNAVYTVVWVTGCGPQGLMAIAVAIASGARKIIATEVKEERLELARKIIRAHSNPREKEINTELVLNPATDPDMHRKIYKATDGLGVDVVLEMSGIPQAVEDGLLALRKGGHLIALGLSKKSKLEVDWNNDIVLKEANIRGIYGRRLLSTWTDLEHFLVTGKINLESIIYKERFRLQDFEKAFSLVQQGKEAKVIFKPNGFEA
jgi:threonine 3-dehydrogenase